MKDLVPIVVRMAGDAGVGSSEFKGLSKFFNSSTIAGRANVVVGLGLSISLPVSSQDMLKSTSTALVREVIMEGDTTFLCIPRMKRITAMTCYSM
ncbi:hypothetical protein E2C01_023203 [Portunus trituberculatus]|uniref:Uncharacterized protein n=1 Tax=Portunus trituberculatus TaxID=210409 RepID=A0A5B7E945_PORTR|nr:hypothetical protein [Portunus trituberculatus]